MHYCFTLPTCLRPVLPQVSGLFVDWPQCLSVHRQHKLPLLLTVPQTSSVRAKVVSVPALDFGPLIRGLYRMNFLLDLTLRSPLGTHLSIDELAELLRGYVYCSAKDFCV